MIAGTEPDALFNALTLSSMKRSNVAFCCVEDVHVTLPPQSNFLVDQRRLTQLGSALSADAPCRQGCTLPAEDASGRLVVITEDGDRTFFFFFKQTSKQTCAIYQVCRVHLHGMRNVSFQLFTHCSDSLHWLHQPKQKGRHLRIGGVLQARHQSWWLVCAPCPNLHVPSVWLLSPQPRPDFCSPAHVEDANCLAVKDAFKCLGFSLTLIPVIVISTIP